MVARRNAIELSQEDRDDILGTMRELPPHPEVPAALERLRQAGLRVAALTTSAQAVATAQLTNAGLAPLFERIVSADAAKRLKPAREAYDDPFGNRRGRPVLRETVARHGPYGSICPRRAVAPG